MNTKLAINLSEGTVHVEGDEAFVRSIYHDFKEYLGKHAARPLVAEPVKPALPATSSTTEEKHQRPRKIKRKAKQPDGEKTKSAEYRPTFRSDLDLKNLEAKYDSFDPKSHNEKILLFAVFLRDELNIAPCSADDIYTCYLTVKKKTATPEAYIQAFRTAENRTHYIEFESVTTVKITIAGDNFYNKKINQKNGASK